MRENIYRERWVKRWLKNVVSITLGVMVAVLINGGIAYGNEVLEKEKTQEEQIAELKQEIENLKMQFGDPGVLSTESGVRAMRTLRASATGEGVHFLSLKGDVDAENYNNDGATGPNSIAIGVGALANGDSGTAIGNKARGTEKSVAIGPNATTHQDRVEKPSGGGASVIMAEEYDSKSSVAIGDSAFARADKSIAIGKDSEAGFLGYVFQRDKQIPGIAIGSGAIANAYFANGEDYNNVKSSGLAIGVDAKATGSGPGIAIGDDAFVGNRGAIALGYGAKAYLGDTNANKHEVTSPNGIAIGTDAMAKGRNSIAIGADSGVYEKIGTANSGSSTPAETNAVALGYHSKVERRGSVALGAWSETRRVSLPGLDESRYATNGDYGSNVVVAPFSNAKLKFYDLMNGANYNDTKNTDTVKKLAVNGVVSVGGVYKKDSGGTVSFGRQIINVADGTEDTDAVNLRQLKGAVNGIGTHFVSVKGDSNLGNYKNDGATANKSVAIGTNARAGGEGATAVGNNAYAETNSAIAIGENVYATKPGRSYAGSGIGIGTNIFASDGTIDIGIKSPNVEMMGGKYRGTNTITNRRSSTTVGTESYAAAHYATILGAYSRINTNPSVVAERQVLFGHEISPRVQGFASAITGALNEMNVDGDTRYDGLANVINGTSNIINHANGAVILGAGNTIENSLRDLDTTLSDSGIKDPKNFNNLVKTGDNALGSVGILGGGNQVESTIFANVQGVRNTVENSEHIGTNGSYNRITNADKAVVIGNDIVLAGTNEHKAQRNIVSGFYDPKQKISSDLFENTTVEVNGKQLNGYRYINDSNSTVLINDREFNENVKTGENFKFYSANDFAGSEYNPYMKEYVKTADVSGLTYLKDDGEYIIENGKFEKVETVSGWFSSTFFIDGQQVNKNDPRLANKKSYTKGYYKINGTTADSVQVATVGSITQNIASVSDGKNIKTGAKDIVALGNNITAQTDNSVYLGANSSDGFVDNQANKDAGHKVTTAGTSAYNSATIGETEYKFAAGTPVGIVSVGAPGKERRIENVAAGLVSEDSTDAINGSQLYSVIKNSSATLKYAGNGYDTGIDDTNAKINLNTGTLTVKGETQGETDSNIVTKAKANGEIVLDLNNTIKVGGTNKVTIGGDDGTVETGNVVINKDGATINKGTANQIVMNSTGITLSNDTTPVNNISISSSGISAGNKVISNVADGADNNDAVNVGQLEEVKTQVAANSNLKYAGDTGNGSISLKDGTLGIKGDGNGIKTVADVDGNGKVGLEDIVYVGGKEQPNSVEIDGFGGKVKVGIDDNQVQLDGSAGEIKAGQNVVINGGNKSQILVKGSGTDKVKIDGNIKKAE
ncbi:MULTISPECIES: hypothetical protein [unclassified Fusobacterium]|uniref:beta strand repeat-containing protein n=2 Tax=unclassified Fusobacterium TaxID=2648384 RepID=UPI001B8D9EE0|nr:MULTISPECIES: hypothetical protein [unclassified Fusobacterium]MBR8701832.1 hypothetical protein [Fusobacterium sp. DD45]MBR8711613.1 hypothetical protein [Fusobacterium sp. DD28]MBR8752162.1 hypothetical protein [Fusobacterium sp. DD26]